MDMEIFNSNDKNKMKQALIFFSMIITSSTFILFIVLIGIIKDKKIIGEICFKVCSLSYISPTQLLIKALNSKDYKMILIYSPIISAVRYWSWPILGLFYFNATVIILNVVGFGFALVKIILFKVYKDKKPLDEKLVIFSTSVIEAMENVVEKKLKLQNLLILKISREIKIMELILQI